MHKGIINNKDEITLQKGGSYLFGLTFRQPSKKIIEIVRNLVERGRLGALGLEELTLRVEKAESEKEIREVLRIINRRITFLSGLQAFGVLAERFNNVSFDTERPLIEFYKKYPADIDKDLQGYSKLESQSMRKLLSH